MSRYASIDVGTNSVLLLVGEKSAEGQWVAVSERAEITRLGKGVDASKRLAPEAIAATVSVIERYVKEARELGAKEIIISATSAARDASNGHEFLDLTKLRTGVGIQIISGDEEARLAFSSAFADFGGNRQLVVVDIGGGSTELIFGDSNGSITFRKSFDVGAVRLTERFIKHDPPAASELAGIDALLKQTFSGLPEFPQGSSLVGVAGTVTTVTAIARAIDPYDATKIQGAQLTRDEIDAVIGRLAPMTIAARGEVKGLQPKRADVVVAGAMVLRAVLDQVKARSCTVSDRGLRWGLLADRFGAAS